MSSLAESKTHVMIASKKLALPNGVQCLRKKGRQKSGLSFALKAIALIHDKSGGSLKISLKRLGRPKALNSGWTRMTTTILYMTDQETVTKTSHV